MSAMALLYNKVKLLFDQFSDPNYVLDSYYGESLINKFNSSKSDEDVDSIVKSPLLSDLIIVALDNIDTCHISVKVFIIRLLAILSYNELHFGRTVSKKGDEIAKGFKTINLKETSPSLKVAYMELALAIVNHTTGISWLLQTDSWAQILGLPNDKQSVFVIRQTYKFASDFLWKLEDLKDEASIIKVLGVVLKPLLITDFLAINSMTSEEEERLAKILQPIVQIIIAIFNNNAEKYRQKTIVVNVLIHRYNLTSRLLSMHDLLHIEELILLFFKSVFWMTSAKIFLTKPLTENAVYDRQDLLEVSAIYYNMVHIYLQKRAITQILDFCNSCTLIWSQVWQGQGPYFENSDGTKIEVQSQFIFLPIVPLLHHVKHKNQSSTQPITDAMINDYILMLLKNCCEHTARAAYGMRDMVKEMDMTSVLLQCVKRLPFLKNHINNEQANFIFKALFFVLRDYDPTDDHGERKVENYEDTAEKVAIMTYVMDTILLIVQNFDINWHVSVEVVCLYTVVAEILKKPNLTTKFIVSSLNVLAMTVKKFQPPNLSLLLESSPGTSAISDIGKLIYLRLHDMHWEIRDSSLELLLVVTEISFIKFPPFQKQILDNKLVEVAATIAQHDTEPYVCATALRVLGAASKVSAVWTALQEAQPDIQDQLLSILRNNQEGIVRKEAAMALCEVHSNIKLSPTFTSILYQHMVSAALTDFHWEVQIAALKFIKGVICVQLSEQGMLDGTFPSVTFSKEKRKIVTLTEKEVQKRLIKSLEELSSIGCLTVLVLLLHEDTEIEIMEHALASSEELLKVLNQYKVQELLENTSNEIESLSEIVMKIKEDVEASEDMEEDGNKSERVIDSILNSSDINLLANIFENQLHYKEKMVEPKLKIEKFVTPSMFVSFLNSKDFKAVIEQKRQWSNGIRSLGSLLDDALGIYEVNDEANTMDCY